jgi:8-oxo-dGTP pyrophosphatase MutT (NUDIX family)
VNAPRLAATVILARPPFELYLARRSAHSAFAPGAFAFPGGTIEAQDASPAALARTAGLQIDRVEREFRASVPADLRCDEAPVDAQTARTLFIAALRELFEEAGVLLARTQSGAPIDAACAGWERILEERTAVRNATLSFADFLSEHGWYADGGALTLFSHWITPPSEPRRYNTHFFFAVAPAGQAALADAFEMHDGLWISPAQALARREAGTMHLVYPTIKHLMRLRAFDSVESALGFARSKPVVTIVPRDTDDDFAIPPTLEDAW